MMPSEVRKGAEGKTKLASGNPNKIAPAANNQEPVMPMIKSIPMMVTSGRKTLRSPSIKMRNTSPRI